MIAADAVENLSALRSPARDDLEARIVRAGLLVSVAALAAQTVGHLADVALLDRRFVLLDADHDESAFAWASVAATAGAAFAAALLAAVLGRWRLVALSGLLAFLSLDDLIGVHERIGELDDTLGLPPRLQFQRLVWIVVFLPLLAAAAILLWGAAAKAPPRAALAVRAGVAALVAGIVLEASTPALFRYDWGQDSVPYETEVVLEEGAELVGWIWVASGLAAFAYAAAARRRA